MFGKLKKPNYVTRPKRKLRNLDIKLPDIIPGNYAHAAPDPRTNYDVAWILYRQQLHNEQVRKVEQLAEELTQERIVFKLNKHIEEKTLNRSINVRFQEKVKAYEDDIKRRREQLSKLLCTEEQTHILETITQAQKGEELKREEMKMRTQNIRKNREAQRLEFVNQQRMQQFINECEDLRLVFTKQNDMNVKATQLQQIKENEMRREAERELDKFYAAMAIKRHESHSEKELQDAIKSNQTKRADLEVLEKQIRGHQLLKKEAEMVTVEDAHKLDELKKHLKREEIEARETQRRKRDELAKEFKRQIALHEKLMATRKEDAKNLDNAMTQLIQKEFQREMKKDQDISTSRKHEWAVYQQHMKTIEEERKREEEHLNRWLMDHKEKFEKKEDEERCKMIKAREELRKSVLADRAQQLEQRKQETENLLKAKEAENTWMRMMCESSARQHEGVVRLKEEQLKQYKEDLDKQIEQSNETKKHEKEQLEREFVESLAEEEHRQQKIQELIKTHQVDQSYKYKHPFRHVLARQECPFPFRPNNSKA